MRDGLLAIAALFSSVAIAGGSILPDGWRVPTEAEVTDDLVETDVAGDFDGNGLTDGAMVVVSEDGKKEGLLAFMVFPGKNKEEWFVLDAFPRAKDVSMGVAKYRPGTYPVLCESDDKCEKGHKTPLRLQNTSIVYYRPESASSIFVWNPKKRGFDRIWESD